MQKIKVLTFFLFLSSVLLLSCDKDDDASSAYAEVKITKSGQSEAGVSVYMFEDNKGPNSGFFVPFHADKTIITEANGVATFNLGSLDAQTTYYFGIFDSNDNVLGSTAMTVSAGQTKNATIAY